MRVRDIYFWKLNTIICEIKCKNVEITLYFYNLCILLIYKTKLKLISLYNSAKKSLKIRPSRNMSELVL